MIEEATGKLYNKKKPGAKEGKKIEKGVAFPTCISVNEVVGHFSPLKGESRVLKEGDVAKIDLACHLDGFIAAAAHTVILGCAETPEMQVDEFEFELNEVYCIDVVMSTGEGKGKETELRTTVFKRQVANSYLLKTQKARQFISEVNRRFPVLPFTLRAIEEEQVARVGVSEARRHELLEDYPVLKEKDKEF